MKGFIIQNSFTAGELSPRLRGRTDLSKYYNGCRELNNFIITPHGGIRRRPGTKFLQEIKNSVNNGRLIPFEFSVDQSYIIELGDNVARFYRNKGIITSVVNVTNDSFTTDITGWTDTSTGTGATAWQTGGYLRLSGGTSGVGISYQKIILKNIDNYTLTMTSNSGIITYKIGTSQGASDIATGTVASGTPVAEVFAATIENQDVYIQFENTNNDNRDLDSAILTSTHDYYEIPTPWSHTEISEIKWTQSSDVMYLVHPNYIPQVLTRLGHDNWTLEDLNFQDGPYLSQNDTSTTITPGATSGSTTLTASSDIFASTDIGRVVRVKTGTTWGWFIITAFTSATVVTADVIRSGGTSATVDWRLGAWSDTTGWPYTTSFHEQRLFFGGTDNQPQTIWGSQSGDFENFSPDNDTNDGSVDNDTAVNFTIASTNTNIIHWLASKKVLTIGTSGAIFNLSASSLNEAITASNIKISKETDVSAENIVNENTDSAIVYIQRHGANLHSYAYSFQTDAYTSPNLSLLSEHLGKRSAFNRIIRQEIPDNVLWLTQTDGSLLSCTYLPDQEVVGWSEHMLGGTDVRVLDMAAIPGNNEQDMYFLVERTINGSTVRYIEYLTEEFIYDNKEDAFFVDSGLTYSGSSATMMVGLDHLEGETVSILANGAVHPDKVVSGGAVTLDYAVTKAQIGLGSTCEIETNNLEVKGQFGTSQGSKGRIYEAVINFYDTIGAEAGYTSSNTDKILFRNASDLMDNGPDLYTGTKVVKINHGHKEGARLFIKNTQPLPITILDIVYKVIFEDK